MIAVYVFVGVVVIAVLGLWLTYNGLVKTRQRVREAWSDIDVQLKRRASLVPNLVETVKGYAAHERQTLDSVTQARTRLMNAGSVQETAEADNQLSGALKTLFAVAESYPDLKANQNFLQLQGELSDLEAKIAYARQFYNTNVRDMNTKVQSFPSVMIARQFGFREEQYYETEEQARADVHVSFTS